MEAETIPILKELRKNARKKLTNISQLINVPTSTLFKKVKNLERDTIRRYTSIVDFSLLGFHTRVDFLLKSKYQNLLKEFLLKHPNVNSICILSGDFDFFVEVIFHNMLELESFTKEVNKLVKNKEVFHIIEDIRHEDFLFVENESIE